VRGNTGKKARERKLGKGIVRDRPAPTRRTTIFLEEVRVMGPHSNATSVILETERPNIRTRIGGTEQVDYQSSSPERPWARPCPLKGGKKTEGPTTTGYLKEQGFSKGDERHEQRDGGFERIGPRSGQPVGTLLPVCNHTPPRQGEKG